MGYEHDAAKDTARPNLCVEAQARGARLCG